MPQIINTNVASLNAQRNLNTSQSALSQALQRLSSGAGLAVESRAAAPDLPPHRLLELPRYCAMEQSFDRIGPHGRSAPPLPCREAAGCGADRPAPSPRHRR